MSRAAGLAFALLTLLGSSCCCCSGDLLEVPEEAQPSDEPAIEAAAREHVAQHQAEIFGGQDAGSSRGECEVDTGGLAVDLGVAVLSRGHSGGSAAGRVSFDPAACARRVVVFVVKQAAVWTVVGVIVYDRVSGAELRRIGTFDPFVEAYDSSGEIDEIF